jgi:hypothetical protein
MAFLHQGTMNILTDVIAYKDQGRKIPTAKLPKCPTNLSARSKRNDVAPTGAIVHECLTIAVLGVASFKCIGENLFANRSSVKVMYFVLVDFGVFTLFKESQREVVSRDSASGRKQPSVEFQGTAKTFIANPHEAGREISHVGKIIWIISSAGRGDRERGQIGVTKGAKLRCKIETITSRKSKDTICRKRPS